MTGRFSRFVALLVFIILSCNGNDHMSSEKRMILTDRPVIGVMAQSTFNMSFEHLGKTYIPASYIKFLESAGARVVPVFNNLTELQTKKLFKSINGALFPGGITSLLDSGYANVSRTIFELAKKTFDEGGYFPIIGMCLGHQLLATLVIGKKDLRIRTDSLNLTASLNLPKNYRDSKLFREIPNYLVQTINKTLITSHFHELGLLLKLFQENDKLKEFYRVITTNVDRKGVEFVSTMEAKKYPFYSTQWHPEKAPFEWCPEKKIPHTKQSIELSQYIANFFVEEARYSKHKFVSKKDEISSLIYNYNPTYTGIRMNSMFIQVYIFN